MWFLPRKIHETFDIKTLQCKIWLKEFYAIKDLKIVHEKWSKLIHIETD